jgi:CRISPR-associated protein Csm2
MNNIETWSAEDIVRKADETASLLTRDKLKTGQIRNFYSAITRMRTDFSLHGYDKVSSQLTMLKPKLAYAAGRQSAVRTNFYPIMKSAIDGVTSAKDKPVALENFFMFIESVVAYHKFYGGE